MYLLLSTLSKSPSKRQVIVQTLISAYEHKLLYEGIELRISFTQD